MARNETLPAEVAAIILPSVVDNKMMHSGYQPIGQENKSVSIAAVCGFAAAVALAGFASYEFGFQSQAPTQMYATTAVRPATRVAPAAAPLSAMTRGAQTFAEVAQAAAQESESVQFGGEQVIAAPATNRVAQLLAMMGVASIVAGAVILFREVFQSKQSIAMAAQISKKDVPLALEEGDLPMNTFNPKKPFKGKVKSVERIVGPNATGETCNIVIDTEGKIPFWEGQSYGVIPPGTKINSKGKEVPHGTRLYSIASSRYGDEFDGKTTTLCVRRATYWCPELGAEDPAKKGICSNFLCDATPGTEITMTGPTGKVLLLDSDPNAVHICVATGTGIAPFRSFWRRMFYDNVPGYKFNGLFWLFMGVANSDALLYDNEITDMAATYPDNFRVDYALSREQTNKSGGKMYIQDRVEEYADQVFDLLSNGAHIYFCGLKGMMPGIQDMLERVAKEKGIDWEEYFKGLKKNHKWHVEVY
jgi:ferredoxin--NADP+ reductase